MATTRAHKSSAKSNLDIAKADWYLEYTEHQEFLLTFADRANFGYDGEIILFAYKINF